MTSETFLGSGPYPLQVERQAVAGEVTGALPGYASWVAIVVAGLMAIGASAQQISPRCSRGHGRAWTALVRCGRPPDLSHPPATLDIGGGADVRSGRL